MMFQSSATGPLTNIATMRNEQGTPIQSRIKEISIMGGSFGLNNRKTLGNVTGSAEFNFYCDPDAAKDGLKCKDASNDKNSWTRCGSKFRVFDKQGFSQ